MTFRTILNSNEILSPLSNGLQKKIDYQSKIGLIGSCFVENISKKLSYFKFDNFVNPYGILFNPKAIEKALSDIVNQRKYVEDDLEFNNELWLSLHHHSSFSNKEASKTIEIINQSIEQTNSELKKTSHLIITLGTAWVYHHIETDQLVANCHKIQQSNFIKRQLSINEIVNSLNKSIELVRSISPEIKLIFTLSPIRHLKDGMIANSLSKARLLSGIHEVIDNLNTFYFPSYEIQIDDLRDYRFYEKDMLHPNELAINCIWAIFKEVWIHPTSFSIMEEIASIQRDMQHKPFNPDSEQHQKFLKNLSEKQEKITQRIGIAF